MPQQWLLDLLWNSLRKMPRGTQVKRDGLAVTVERRGISSRIALRLLSHPRLHVQSPKDHSGEETALQGVGPRVKLSRQYGLKVSGGPHTSSHPNYIWGALGINNCGRPISQFLLDTGATFSVLTEAPGSLSSQSTTKMDCLDEWVKSLSHVRFFVTPWTVAYQVPPSMGFSRQEYWSGLPFPSPGDLPNPGIEPGSPTL